MNVRVFNVVFQFNYFIVSKLIINHGYIKIYGAINYAKGIHLREIQSK